MSTDMNKTIYSKEHRYVIERLKKARKEAGLDQKDVAGRLGRTQSYVSKMESGQRRIDIVLLKELANIYKRKLNYFVE